jgi:hypothetical protein
MKIMKLEIVEKIEIPSDCYELVLNYANRDDELTEKRLYFKDPEEKQKLMEILEILNQGINVDYMNGEKFYRDIPNFSKYFIFQNVGEIFDEQLVKNWKENWDIDIFMDMNWERFGAEEIIDKYGWNSKESEELENKIKEEYHKEYSEDRILWDYQTCSGEISLEIWSYELYLYGGYGEKYKVEVSE